MQSVKVLKLLISKKLEIGVLTNQSQTSLKTQMSEMQFFKSLIHLQGKLYYTLF